MNLRPWATAHCNPHIGQTPQKLQGELADAVLDDAHRRAAGTDREDQQSRLERVRDGIGSVN